MYVLRAMAAPVMIRTRERCSVGGTAPLSGTAALVVALALLLPSDGRAQDTPPRVPRHFTAISDGLPEEMTTAAAFDPGDPEVLFAGLDGFLFKSDDGGGTWRPVLSFPRGLSIDAEMALQEGTAGDADLDDDSPLPARVEDPDLPIADDIDLRDADDLEELEELEEAVDDAALDDPGLDDTLRPSRGGRDGTSLPAGDADLRASFPRQEAGVRAIRFASPSSPSVFVATPRGLFRSVDGGESFTEIELPGGALVNDVRDVAVDPMQPTRLYVATADGTLVSSDGGAGFTRAPDLLGTTPALAVIARRVNDQDMVVIGTERGLWRSWDGGATFREMLLKGVSAFEGVGSVAFDERTGITYAGTLQGLFAGERESALLEPRHALFGEPVFAISIDPKRDRGVTVGLADRGVVHSEDTGITLVDLPDVLPATTAFDLARPSDEPDAIVAATERGLFRFVKGTGIRVSEDRLQRLVRDWKKEPSLEETAIAAVAYAGLDPNELRDAISRARFAPLLPELRLRYRYKRGRPDREEYIVAVEDPDAIDEDDTEEILDLARDGVLIDAPSRGVTWDVYALATWNLDAVLFNPAEMRAARQLPTVFAARQRVLNRVETLYTARRRLMAEIYLSDKAVHPAKHARTLLRLAELTALLSAMTGGAFLDVAQQRGAPLAELTGSLDPEPEAERTLPNPRRR